MQPVTIDAPLGGVKGSLGVLAREGRSAGSGPRSGGPWSLRSLLRAHARAWSPWGAGSRGPDDQRDFRPAAGVRPESRPAPGSLHAPAHPIADAPAVEILCPARRGR